MPGGRRHIQTRGHPIRPPPTLTSTVDDGKTRPGGTDISLGPKHFPMPTTEKDPEFYQEFVNFIHVTLACALQFLHLYRSVWWLQDSHNNNTLNFYLVDPYLIGFIVTILARQVVYCGFKTIILPYVPQHLRHSADKVAKVALLVIIVIILTWCTICVIKNNQLVNILYLCYPISVYFIIFGFRIGPFFSSYDIGSYEQIQVDVTHICPASAPSARAEVEKLKTDFNARLRLVLFNSVLSAYYAGFVPCCFAQSALVYDLTWATQHLCFVWLGSFTLSASNAYPLEYVDMLHRASVHLGRWSKLEGCRSHLPTHNWVEQSFWPSGSLVKLSRETFRAEGIQSVSAEPGNSTHSRFYMLFNNPTFLPGILLCLQGILIFGQLFFLTQFGGEWWHIISITLTVIVNYSSLFKLTRDTCAAWRHFKHEKIFHAKLVSG